MSDPRTTSRSYRFRSFEKASVEPSVPEEIATFIMEHKLLSTGIAMIAFLVCAFLVGYGVMSTSGI